LSKAPTTYFNQRHEALAFWVIARAWSQPATTRDDVAGKRRVVTGASSGIYGAAYAPRNSAEWRLVKINDLRNEKRSARDRDKIKPPARAALVVKATSASRGEVARAPHRRGI